MRTRQEQIEEMQKTICINCKDRYSKKGYVCPWQDKDTKCYNCEKLSEALYNAGYQILKQGKWLVSDQGRVITCSNCNKQLELYYPDGTEVGPALTYCPYCGAKNRKV